ncbi:hypothetical protein SAMN02746041_03083 [Desulfacinum hydrothermale DSM 13146]|uniref:Uncharacterized protein n=1 Tax=Desulfacinum hydrothermale DSM 13146 TaxID=1121390 RepID=A0A1W1XV95_9BACT|nr:hypothetical protein [Desulfacinum hydrothermale]SMC27807.1 hypothetical protein SAMN02746041_03083 [Desulfacinum hydrothermale DSM 13146]
MTKNTAIMCLAGGVFLFILGAVRLWKQGDWVLIILSALIMAFSTSSLLKNRNSQ